jgi:hypothetical protein
MNFLGFKNPKLKYPKSPNEKDCNIGNWNFKILLLSTYHFPILMVFFCNKPLWWHVISMIYSVIFQRCEVTPIHTFVNLHFFLYIVVELQVPYLM